MADAILNGEPYSRFPNGLPLLIAGLKIFLPTSWIPASIIWTNILASTAAVGLTIGISKKITGNTFLACLAGLILAIYPNQLNYVRQILTEAPATFFLVFHVYLFFHRRYFSSAAILFIAVLFRSSLLPLIPLMLIFAFAFERSGNPKIPILKFIGGLVSITLIYMLFVIFEIVKPSANLSANLLISISSYGGNIDYTLSGFTNAELDSALNTYFTFAVEHPWEYIKQRILSFNELWGWPSTGEPQRSFAKKLLIALRIPFFIGAVVAFCQNLKKPEIWVLFSPVLIITAIHTMFFSTTRFSYVAEPFIIILTLILLESIYKKWFNKAKYLSV
ncbi:hypothetical protein [Rhodohalobacter sulfatireducens]|uniref:Glycosyltransferase RgtA/B/C/D-like domain-containing protein n=1 Tax=Rhodohalobacter sulfatireducens TaxID=2911366 RepID=A0ABS9KD30_9BACT|nr:hypothetical protein [Rhodohalobacter sulfatireducens]MCG2588748.1 hypothetical protein [Rhodohalobacter sulfatireducens]